MLRIGGSICSLNKTQTPILILITSNKTVYVNVLEHKTAFPDGLFPSIFPVKTIQVRKLVSHFVRPLGCESWLSSQAFDEKRKKTGDKTCHQFFLNDATTLSVVTSFIRKTK